MGNLAGPRRLSAGAARDHLLGFSGVNGRGEAFKSGGRVMKNVTGYDLSKLLAGSWGTLAVLDEVSVKVLPAPDQTATLLLKGLDDGAAVKAMCAAMGSPHEVSGAAHARGTTALRVEGVAPSVQARLKGLRELLARQCRGDGGARHARKPRLLARGARCRAARRGRRTRSCGASPARRARGQRSSRASAHGSPRSRCSTTGPAASSGSPCRRAPTPTISSVRAALGATGGHATLDPRATDGA